MTIVKIFPREESHFCQFLVFYKDSQFLGWYMTPVCVNPIFRLQFILLSVNEQEINTFWKKKKRFATHLQWDMTANPARKTVPRHWEPMMKVVAHGKPTASYKMPWSRTSWHEQEFSQACQVKLHSSLIWKPKGHLLLLCSWFCCCFCKKK